MENFLRRCNEPGNERLICVQEFTSPNLRISDPLDFNDAPSICFKTPIGKFPIKLVQKDKGPEPGYPRKEVNAFLALEFSQEPALEWRHIVPRGQPADRKHEFSAEFGWMAIYDEESFDRLRAIEEETDDQLWDEFLSHQLHSDEQMTLSATVNLPNASTPKQFAVCYSGLGNGCYPAYMGLAKNGEPTCIIVDFEVN